VAEEEGSDIQVVKGRVDLIERRLDDIDSMVTAIAERVMTQPVTLIIMCPHCGKNIEVVLMGTHRPG
jgi:hypothetical protein